MKVWNEWRNTEQLNWGRAYTISSNLRVGLECRTKILSSQKRHITRIALFTVIERNILMTFFAL